MKCPYGKRVIDPCDRKIFSSETNACQSCIDKYRELVEIFKKFKKAKFEKNNVEIKNISNQLYEIWYNINKEERIIFSKLLKHSQ
jgi:hypothetical protein